MKRNSAANCPIHDNGSRHGMPDKKNYKQHASTQRSQEEKEFHQG